MTDLDKKLNGIIAKAMQYGDLRRKWGNDPKYVPDPREVEEELIDSIKQAFIDAGYAPKATMDDIHILGKSVEEMFTILRALEIERVTEIEVTMRNLDKLYDRLRQELQSTNDEAMKRVFESVGKASGVK